MEGESFLRVWKNDIESKIGLANDSISWWESQLDLLFDKLEKIESSEWYPEKDAELDSITDEIHSLMARGKFEHQNLDSLQKEMDNFSEAMGEKLRKISKIAMRLDINLTL